MPPKISLIIVNWNGKHHLQECLHSISKQSFDDFEIILVDNGSTDGSIDFVKKNYGNVKIIEESQNHGFCKGNNIGLNHARGEFIALLNNDTKADKNWLQELYNAIEQENQVGICASCMVNYYNPEIIDTAGDGYDISGVGFKTGNGEAVSKHQEKCYVFGACAGAALYRRSMIEKIGFFDEDFFAMGEDIDLSFRARLAGYKCVYVPTAVVYHKINQTIVSGSDFLVYHARRNVEYTYFKNMPALLLIMTLPFHLIYEILTLFEALINGKLMVFIKCKFDFLKKIPAVLRKRKSVQSYRVVALSEILSLLSWNYLLQKTLNRKLSYK